MRVKRLLVLLFTIVLLFPTASYAAGTTTISISNSSPKIGDKFTVNIKATESGKMTVGYRSNILTLVGNDVEGQQTSSHSFTFTGKSATLTFEAISEGNSGIVIESDTLTGSSISVNVAKPASQSTNNSQSTTEQPTQEQPTTEQTNEQADNTNNESENLPAQADFNVDGIDYVVSEKFTDEELLKNFYRTKQNINGRDVDVATNNLLSLVYLKPSEDTSQQGIFYVYNSADNTVSALTVIMSESDYVILQNPDTLFSSKLEGTTFNVEGIDYSGYTFREVGSEFCYIYGINNIPVEGWFAYDSYTGRIYRADTATLSLIDDNVEEPVYSDVTETTEKKPFNIPPKVLLFASIGFLILIVIIIIINAFIRRRRDDDWEEIDDDYNRKTDNGSIYNKKAEPDISFETKIVSENITEDIMETQNDINVKSNIFEEINSDDLIDSLIKNASKKEDQGIIDFDDE